MKQTDSPDLITESGTRQGKQEQALCLLDRKETIAQLTGRQFDILVIGGGITGAGIALDAASRGLKTALIEKQDFAAGTSSRSTKLIHGGLRYLEHLELGLVHKAGREREILHQNAPHLVIPEKMLLPIIKDGTLGEFTTSLALYVYDYLAGVKRREHRRMLTFEETLEREPLLDPRILKGGALYYEYRTDDSRLTIEVIKKAAEYGAVVINYVEATDFVYQKRRVEGVAVKDLVAGMTHCIYSKYTVNATGVWVDRIRDRDNSLDHRRLHITKGIHIVVPSSRLPLRTAMYFDVGDRRMIFAIPRDRIVYIGTTDTEYAGSLENPDITRNDIEYLLAAVRRIAPSIKLTVKDVESAWSGLRPLIHQEGKAPSELSRKDEVFLSESRLISIAGGKLTGYRLMAKRVVDLVCKRLARREKGVIPKCQTRYIKLAGGEFQFEPELSRLAEYADSKYPRVSDTGISRQHFRRLFHRYGTNLDRLIAMACDFYRESGNSREAWLKAEVWYTVRFEMATSLCDFFIRRTGMIHFQIAEIATAQAFVADTMADLLGWDEDKKNQELEALAQAVKHATEFT